MHGGIPRSSGYYHVNISLFNEKNRAPIQMQFEMISQPLTMS